QIAPAFAACPPSMGSRKVLLHFRHAGHPWPSKKWSRAAEHPYPSLRSILFAAGNPAPSKRPSDSANGPPRGESGGPFVHYRLAPGAKLVHREHDLRCELATQILVQGHTHLPIEHAHVTFDLVPEQLRIDDLRSHRCFLHLARLGACRMLCEQAHGESNGSGRQ